MQLFVLGESLRCLEVDEGTTVAQLRENLGEEGVLTHCGLPLEEGDCVFDLPALTTLHLAPRLLGGKVHGSLARAGKVKGQTPKVAKEEDKKKKKTGRCKRRIQYNRRFSTAVNQFGRKKGPNSNSD